MSNHLISTTYKRDLRTPMRKSVMALLADKASDDGAGIYASKQTMADELCCSRQAVIDTIKGLEADGLLVVLGQRKAPNGYTVEYGIDVAALEALPLVACHAARASRASTSCTGQRPVRVKEDDGSTSLTPPVKQVDPNPPEPIPSPEASPPPKPRAKRATAADRGSRLPSDWKPIRFADDTVAREVIDRRGRDWGRAALESFRNWAANADDRVGRKRDWQAAWANWVIEQDRRDGNRSSRRMDGQPGVRGSRPDPALDLLNAARAAEEAERAGGGGEDHRGTWLALPPGGAG